MTNHQASSKPSGSQLEPIPALFIGSTHAFAETPGGQQLCTKEFLASLELGGFEIERLSFKPCNQLHHKVARRFDRRPYRYFVPNELANQAVESLKAIQANTVFLNTVDLLPVAPRLKKLLPDSTIVLLSHGIGSVDYIHELRIGDSVSKFSSGLSLLNQTSVFQERRLGQLLLEEARQRFNLDGVITISDLEQQIEYWLGAQNVMVAPRTVSADSLEWKPVDGRIGFVGRLDHPPNVEGLALLLEELNGKSVQNVRVRIVGAPSREGKIIAERFPMVDYLGVLSDEELVAEASTWACGINPVFCYPRGATTKLAVLLGWSLPLVTTSSGFRGYEWTNGELVTADSPQHFAEKMLQIAQDPTYRAVVRENVMLVKSSTVGLNEVGQRMRVFVTEIKPNEQ